MFLWRIPIIAGVRRRTGAVSNSNIATQSSSSMLYTGAYIYQVREVPSKDLRDTKWQTEKAHTLKRFPGLKPSTWYYNEKLNYPPNHLNFAHFFTYDWYSGACVSKYDWHLRCGNNFLEPPPENITPRRGTGRARPRPRPEEGEKGEQGAPRRANITLRGGPHGEKLENSSKPRQKLLELWHNTPSRLCKVYNLP